MQAIEGAVIAAAGLGSRLGLGLPKAMLKIGGITLLSRQVKLLSQHVSKIHIVVGYREELIIEHCARFHREVVLIRNKDYRNTNTAYSYDIGARGIQGKTLFMDGDLIIDGRSMDAFISAARKVPAIAGITIAKSDQAVYVQTDWNDIRSYRQVKEFSREVPTEFEWANVVVGPPDLMSGTTGFVYQQLEKMLPLPAFELELEEVDTPDDLERAQRFALSHNL